MKRKQQTTETVILPEAETLDGWLERMLSPESNRQGFNHFCFPTDTIALEYLEAIHTRSPDEVLQLAAALLDGIENVGSDGEALKHLDLKLAIGEPTFTYGRRLRSSVGGDTSPRDGIQWALRLAERRPRLALEALHAYWVAHCVELPDMRLSGLTDVESMIRHRFIVRANRDGPSAAALASLGKGEFELLVAALYAKMGFKVIHSGRSRDGGIDVIAEKSEAGQSRRIAVQCKLPDKNPVGVSVVRELLGVALRPTFTSCAVVTSRQFTREARSEFRDDHRVELIDGEALRELLNAHFGSAWPRDLPSLIRVQETEEIEISGP